MHMLKVYHFVFCFCFLLSCSASEQEKISYETNSNEEINTPAFVVADFHTFNLAFFGCEEIKSNRNWNALNDSIYLTVNKMPDSIVVYETRGIENLRPLQNDQPMLLHLPTLLKEHIQHLLPEIDFHLTKSLKIA